MRNLSKTFGFTLVELLIVLAILAILFSFVFGISGGWSSGRNVNVEVTEKWTDLDYEGVLVYRIRTVSPDGDVETWNSLWCHDDVKVGNSYNFQSYTGNLISKVTRLDSVKGNDPNGNSNDNW